ncbi:hypothetical protein J4G37_20940 [Microvirga sp. 3-52]|jgi:hypothetical protein|nr:hypothetical protein [Microvirga sp. 3-52]
MVAASGMALERVLQGGKRAHPHSRGVLRWIKASVLIRLHHDRTRRSGACVPRPGSRR